MWPTCACLWTSFSEISLESGRDSLACGQLFLDALETRTKAKPTLKIKERDTANAAPPWVQVTAWRCSCLQQRRRLRSICKLQPTATPGMTHNIGSQTGPSNTPNKRQQGEYMQPTVTK